MAVIFIFVDGIGLGGMSESNPFHRIELPAFSLLAGGQSFTSQANEVVKKDHLFKGIDATLGVEGLPQSGTGQTTLFIGKNAARVIGKHFGPYPHSGIKPLLKKESIFNRLVEKEKQPEFINAYPDIFFERAEKNNRWSCTTLMAKSAGIPLNREEDVRQGKAVTAGITQRAWREKLAIDVPEISPETAAKRVLQKAEIRDLVLYEYYLTDKAGHSRDMEKARKVLRLLDNFLSELIDGKRDEDTVLLSSDHGNLEDLDVKTHTYNHVPLAVIGPAAEGFSGAESIADVTPEVLRVLSGE